MHFLPDHFDPAVQQFPGVVLQGLAFGPQDQVPDDPQVVIGFPLGLPEFLNGLGQLGFSPGQKALPEAGLHTVDAQADPQGGIGNLEGMVIQSPGGVGQSVHLVQGKPPEGQKEEEH